MPLGDFYRPDPELLCPICGGPITEWDGFGGPGAFLLFRQGEAAPAERRLGSQGTGDPRLPDGRIPLFGRCFAQHSTMAEAIVEDGAWVRTVVIDAEGSDALPLAGPWVLWRGLGSKFSISTLTPSAQTGVVPASITAIGLDPACILVTRRADTRDPACLDEWWIVDVARERALGPIADAEVRDRLAELGLPEPAVMRLPEDPSLRQTVQG